MKPLHRLFLIIFFVTILSARHSHAVSQETFQEGYIVTLKGDTTEGWVFLTDHVLNSRKCVFKRTREGSAETYTPDQISAFGVRKRKYFYSYELPFSKLSQRIEGKVFLECIVKSDVSLFFLRDRYFFQSTDEMQELIVSQREVTEGSKTYVQRQSLYKLVLRREMADCLAIDEYLAKTTFTLNSLRKLFTSYLQCTDRPFVVYSGDHEKVALQISFMPGFQTSSLKFKSGGSAEYEFANNGKTDWTQSFMASVIVEFSRKESGNRARVRTGLNFYNNKFEFFEERPVQNLNYQLNIERTAIEVPVLLKYSPSNILPVYVQAGVGLNAILKWKDRLTVIVPPSFIYREASDLKPANFSVNILAGVGIDFAIGKQRCMAEISYGINPFMLEDKSLQATIRSLTIGAGVRF